MLVAAAEQQILASALRDLIAKATDAFIDYENTLYVESTYIDAYREYRRELLCDHVLAVYNYLCFVCERFGTPRYREDLISGFSQYLGNLSEVALMPHIDEAYSPPLRFLHSMASPVLGAANDVAPIPDATMVEHICRRLPRAAQILASRVRKGKASYAITDEYDVQDLLHATLRAYLRYSVQEDPVPTIAAAKSARADISIEELGVIVEVKFVHGPKDQKRLFEDYSQDLILYAQWPHLKTLVYFIYNSADLRDPEAFERLSGEQEIGGKRFNVRVVLA